MGTRLLEVLLLAVTAACFPQQSQVPIEAPEVPLASNAAADTLLVDVQGVDSSIVVDLRYATPNNFTGARLPGYHANRALLRGEAAVALALVNADLRADAMGLKIYDAYRPVRATEAMVEWTRSAGREDLLRDGYIASRSRHNLGVAVDVTLIDLATGAEISMGTPYDHFSPASHTRNARGAIARNRRRLVAAMERHGFRNYEREWWHFSYEVENPVRFDREIR